MLTLKNNWYNMKKYIFFVLLFCTTSVVAQYKTLYDFSARTIDGNTLHFSSLKRKKVLIVNTASECMLT
ncbi:MAG TPA: hypothetical protein VEP89_06520, partial [Draconibacterium sp.]|nr:hypothetical protein [Draconibacterium sp.]